MSPESRLGLRIAALEEGPVRAARARLELGPATARELARIMLRLDTEPEHGTAELFVRKTLGARPEMRQAPDGQWRLERRDGERLRQELAGVPLDALRYAVVDVETTGGMPATGHRITEIAIVRVEGTRIVDEWSTLVNPLRPIPPNISRITGIFDHMVRGQPRFPEIAHEVVRRLEGHVFVAHNAPFDWRFVAHAVQDATGHMLEGETLCTVRLARKLLPDLPRRNLDSVALHYGAELPPEVRHRAGGDAHATAQVLLGLLRDAAARDITTWGALAAFHHGGTGRRRRTAPSALPRPVRDAGDAA
jgi:DNA polymerase-3 subunit epsilon